MQKLTICLLTVPLVVATVSAFVAVGPRPASVWGSSLNRASVASSPLRVLMSETDATDIAPSPIIEEAVPSPVVAEEVTPPVAAVEEDIATKIVPIIEEDESNQSRKVERERHTIFVGNLPFETSSQEIKDLFEKYGKVELVAIPKNKVTDQPRGFAFVDMGSREELDAAIAALDGSNLGSRQIRASRSVPQEERDTTEKKQPRKDRAPRSDDSSKKIYVGNLPFDSNADDLMQIYQEYGSVKDIFVPQNGETGTGRGFAFVTMMNEEDIEKAIDATNGMDFQGRSLVVSKPLPPGEKAPVRRAGRTKLYIGNLSFYTVAETLKEIFEEFGEVLDCYLPEDPSTGGTRGFGFITMARDDAMTAVSELDGAEVDGRVIRVNEAKPKGRGFDDENTEIDMD